MAEAADGKEAMIAEDKDRLDCLKLAVSLVIPRQGVTNDKMADTVIDAAKKFYEFVSTQNEKSK